MVAALDEELVLEVVQLNEVNLVYLNAFIDLAFAIIAEDYLGLLVDLDQVFDLVLLHYWVV